MRENSQDKGEWPCVCGPCSPCFRFPFFCTWACSPNPSPHVIFVRVSRAELCGRDKQLPNLRGLTQQRLVSHSCYVSGVVNGETTILSTQQSSFHAYEGKANHMPTPNQMRIDKYYRTTCLGE